MARFLLRRVGGALLVLLAVSFVTFSALTAAPGDAASGLLGDGASQEQVALLRQSMGLDLPLLTRYGSFLSRLVFQGDLGRSLIGNRPVAALILDRLPYTVGLALSASGLALLLGGMIGLAAALRAGTWVETTLMGVAVVGLAVPVFWSALLLMMLFSLRLDWLPVAGAGTWQHLVLPTLTLALPTAATVARLTRASLLDVLGADYVRTAQAKGLRRGRILSVHVLRNSLIPVLTVLGLQLGHLLGGAFVIETIFAWPGLGRLAVLAIFDRDVPVVMGATLLVAVFYVALNLLVDILQGWLDPRVAHGAI